MSQELKPCPFCGNLPRITQRGGHDERDGYTVIHAVKCFKCWTEKSSAEQPFGGPTAEMAKSAAIRLWNARATPQPTRRAQPVQEMHELEVTDEMVELGLSAYSEGGCMGLSQHERREVVADILTAALKGGPDDK